MNHFLPKPLRFCTDDGLTLRADTWGNQQNPAVLFLHGGGQTRHAWGDTARILCKLGWYAIALDLRGHGESDWSPDADYRIERFSQDVLQILRHLPTPVAVAGASLGGASALVAQAAEPDRFRCLVLVDITPRVQSAGVHRIKDFMTKYLERGFANLEEAADAVAAYLPERPSPQNHNGLKKNLRLDKDGRYRWHWDPRFITSKRGPANESLQSYLLEAARSLRIPTLLVRGKMSDVVSESDARDFLDMVPHADFIDVSEAGHMVAGDRNNAFTNAIVSFLRKI